MKCQTTGNFQFFFQAVYLLGVILLEVDSRVPGQVSKSQTIFFLPKQWNHRADKNPDPILILGERAAVGCLLQIQRRGWAFFTLWHCQFHLSPQLPCFLRFLQVCDLLRPTGYSSASKRPANYPESLFSRLGTTIRFTIGTLEVERWAVKLDVDKKRNNIQLDSQLK